MHQVFILLGSNIGDRLAHLQQARELLVQFVGEIAQASSIYETAAWGKTNQASFCNQALILNTELAPEDVLMTNQQLEEKMGREPGERWGERIIDIDILYYDQILYQSSILQIPHPEIANRRFTLVALCDIAPDFIHPKLGLSQRDLLEHCADNLAVDLFVTSS